MSGKSGRVAVYIEGHAESLVTATSEGTAGVERLTGATEQLDAAQRTGTKGFASYTTTTKKHAAEADKAAASTEKQTEKTGLLAESTGKATGAVGGLIAAYAGYEAVDSAVKFTEELVHNTQILTRVTDLDTKSASQWIELAKQRGIDTSQLGMAFGTLSKQIRGAETGSSSATKAFHALGIPLDQLRKMSTEEVLLRISDAFHGMSDGAEKAALNQQFFGKSARSLLPVLDEGSGAVKKQLSSFKGLSDSQLEQGEQAIEIQRKVSRAYDEARVAVTFWLLEATKNTAAWIKETAHGEGAVGRFGTQAVRVGKEVVEASKEAGQWLGNATTNAVNASVDAFHAFTGAIGATSHAISQTAHDVSGFVRSFIPFKIAVLAAKIALAPVVLSVLGCVKALGVFKPAIGAAASVLRSVFSAALKVTGAAIQTWLKVVGDIGSVVGDVVGVVSNLLRGKWGNAWDDAKQTVTDVMHTIEDLVKGVWTQIKTVFTTGTGLIKSTVQTGFGAIGKIVSNAEGFLGGAFKGAWSAIRSTFASGVNDVIGFIDTLASVVEDIPGVPSLQIPKITVGGGDGKKEGSGGPKHQSKAGYARGGHITKPMYMVGEEAPQHPEWVVATNPAYRKKNIQYWAQAGHDLGIPGFFLGGLTNAASGALSSVGNAVGGVGGTVLNSAKAAIGVLPTPHFPHWLGDLGGYIVGHVSDWIKSGFSSGSLGSKPPAGGMFKGKLPAGVGSFDGMPVDKWIIPILAWAKKHGWDGDITSGYRSEAEQAELYANRGSNPNPVAPPGSSNHERTAYPGGAIDTSDYTTLAALMKVYPRSPKLVWGPDGGNPDDVHFSATGRYKGGRIPGYAEGGVVGTVGSILLRNGLDPVAAAAILGSAYGESGWNPSSVGSGGDGLWGFTTSPVSPADLAAYAQSQGKPWDDAATQTQFLLHHLPTSMRTAMNEMSSVAEATTYFVENWEKPETLDSLPTRIEWGEKALKMIGGANAGSATSATTKHAGPATTKQKHRLGVIQHKAAAVIKEVQRFKAQYAQHGGTKAGKAALIRGLKLAKEAAAAHKVGNSEQAAKLIEEATTELAKARSSAAKGAAGAFVPGLKPHGLSEAAKQLPGSLQALLKSPGITFAQKLGVGETAATLAGNTEGHDDDVSAAAFQKGLLQKDRARIKKRLAEVAARLKKGGLTKAQQNKLLAEQSSLVQRLGGDETGIAAANQTIHEKPEEAESEASEEEAQRQQEVITQLEAIVALTKEQADKQAQALALLESQSGPEGTISKAISALVSGQIGGKVGLGFQTPSVAGSLASY